MKKAIGILALLVFAGNIASAELLKNFKYDGKIVIHAKNVNNEKDANSKVKDNSNDVDPRVELNASFDLADDVNAIVSAVKCTRQYGEGSETVAAATADGFSFEQAYLNLKGVLGIDHKVGRQYYGNEGDLVVYYGPRNMPYNYGTLANGLSITGLDAYTGWYKAGKLDIHGIMGKIANDTVTTQPDLDTNLVGVVGMYDLMEPLKIKAYVYEQKTTVAASADTTLDVIGVKGTGTFMGFNYYGELAKNYGRNAPALNYTGTGFLAGANYGLNLLGKWTFSGEMGIGSGDDKTTDKKISSFTLIATDYRPGILFGGFSGNTGLNNLTTWNLGAVWAPEMIEKLTLGGKLYHFAPTETKVDGVKIGYDAYGSELDLTANWQHNEYVGLMAYYSAFMVDGDYADVMLAGKDDMATALGVAVSVKF